MLLRKNVIDLSMDERRHFIDAVATDPNSGGVQNVISAIDDHRLDLFVWSTEDSCCVVITRVGFALDGERDIFVVMLAGDNATRYYNEICDSVNLWGATLYETTKMTAIIKKNAWEAFKRHGANADEEWVFIVKNGKGEE